MVVVFVYVARGHFGTTDGQPPAQPVLKYIFRSRPVELPPEQLLRYPACEKIEQHTRGQLDTKVVETLGAFDGHAEILPSPFR